MEQTKGVLSKYMSTAGLLYMLITCYLLVKKILTKTVTDYMTLLLKISAPVSMSYSSNLVIEL